MVDRLFRISLIDAVRRLCTGLLIVLVGYLCLVALVPSIRTSMPDGLRWFGAASSWQSALIVTALFAAILVLRWLPGRSWSPTYTGRAIASLVVAAFLLGVSSYISCPDDRLLGFWPISSALAGSSEGLACSPVPLALELARLAAVATVLAAVVATVTRAFSESLDRFRVGRAREITAIIGIEDDCIPLLERVADATAEGRQTLVVVTGNPDRECIRVARQKGARVIVSDLSSPANLGELPIWTRLARLYLISDDTYLNLEREAAIKASRADRRSDRIVPLTIRIDDPWQAEIWRRGNSIADWAINAVSIHESTAMRVAESIWLRDPRPSRVIVTGTSRLSTALCSELARGARAQPVVDPASIVPECIVVAPDATSFVHDHRLRQRRLTPDPSPMSISAVDEPITIDTLSELAENEGTSRVAFVLTAPSDDAISSRLATRHPYSAIYLCVDGTSTRARNASIGNIHVIPPMLSDTDGWERAARRVHEVFTADKARTDETATASMVPWEQLSPALRQDNRRSLVNALRLVQVHGNSTWDAIDRTEPSPLPPQYNGLDDIDPYECAGLLGFTASGFERMVTEEHADWLAIRTDPANADRFPASGSAKPWNELSEDQRAGARTHFIKQLLVLRQLGFCSIPTNREYRRAGVATAHRLTEPYEWQNHAGELMTGKPGDWLVTSEKTGVRTVDADEFDNLYAHVADDVYERRGTVQARPAMFGETIETLEGASVAQAGNWVVTSTSGERWITPATSFDGDDPDYVLVDDQSDDLRESRY